VIGSGGGWVFKKNMKKLPVIIHAVIAISIVLGAYVYSVNEGRKNILAEWANTHYADNACMIYPVK